LESKNSKTMAGIEKLSKKEKESREKKLAVGMEYCQLESLRLTFK